MAGFGRRTRSWASHTPCYPSAPRSRRMRSIGPQPVGRSTPWPEPSRRTAIAVSAASVLIATATPAEHPVGRHRRQPAGGQRELFELLTVVGNRLLLGGANQMIYDMLPGRSGVGPQRLTAALARPGAEQIDLPLDSHRDPTMLLPTIAEAVRQRNFNHPALAEAAANGRLSHRDGATNILPSRPYAKRLTTAASRQYVANLPAWHTRAGHR